MLFHEHTCLAWSTDPVVRRTATSGGFTRELLRHALESGYVDRVICIRTAGVANEVIVTSSWQDFWDRRSCSVYQETKDLVRTFRTVDPSLRYAVTCLPCHMAFLSRSCPWIVLTVELLCNYWPQQKLLLSWLRREGIDTSDVKDIYYRGDGWPGKFSCTLHNGETVSVPYLRFWDGRRWKYGPGFCQKCCRLSCGGDFVVGDPWRLMGDMGTGKTLVRVRKRHHLVSGMVASGRLAIQSIAHSDFTHSTDEMVRQKKQQCQ